MSLNDNVVCGQLLLKACKTGDISTVSNLLESDIIKIDHVIDLALRKAAKYGYDIIVDALLNAGADPSDRGSLAFIKACGRNHLSTASRLLKDSRTNPTEWKNRALKAAVRNGHYDIVKLLFTDWRINSKKHRLAFISAVKNGYIEIVEFLYKYNKITDLEILKCGIKRAIFNNHMQVFKMLLESSLEEICENSTFINTIVVFMIYKGRFNMLDYIFNRTMFEDNIGVGVARMIMRFALAFSRYKHRHLDGGSIYMRVGSTSFPSKPIPKKKISKWRFDIIDLLFSYPLCYKVADFSEICFEHISMIRTRATEVCVALFDLNLPALQTVHILDELIPNCVSMWAMWELVTKVKHFHDRR